MNNEHTSPYGIIRLRKSNTDKSLYYVFHKEGVDVSGFLGKLPNEPYIGNREFLIMEFDLQWDEGDWGWSMYNTTNPLNTEIEQVEDLYQGTTKTLITRFRISQGRRAYGQYNDDAILIEFSEDWNTLTILFYENMGRYSENLFTVWNYGLLENTVAVSRK
jgi:hypothetical protein